MQQSYLLVSFV